MAASQDLTVDKNIHMPTSTINPATIEEDSVKSYVESEKYNLQQIASNFLTRYFQFRTNDSERNLNVVQIMSEYNGNFTTPVCYLRFHIRRAGKFLRFAEELGQLSGRAEINRLNCIRIYKDFIQRYTDLIGAIQTHASTCHGRLFRRSIERMQSEISHVPINLHLQQLLVSCTKDSSATRIYNTITLGAPAVHHLRFTQGGLTRIKANEVETNKILVYLQNTLQSTLVLIGDIEDALDHLTKALVHSTKTNEYQVLKWSLEKTIKAIDSLLSFSKNKHEHLLSSSNNVVVNPLIQIEPCNDESTRRNLIYEKVQVYLEAINDSLNKNQQTFDTTKLNDLKSIVVELESYTCQFIMRHIFEESMEIERYSVNYRDRFDIAFSHALTCLIFSIFVLLSSVTISDQAWKIYINHDGLLNRFDELSQRHSSLMSNFEKNLTDVVNPLRSVARTEDEQQKTIENLSRSSVENDNQTMSFASLEEFNKRVVKSRCHHRPPSYCSNDANLLYNRFPSRISWTTTESITTTSNSSALTIRPMHILPHVTQPIASTSIENLVESTFSSLAKTKPKVVLKNPPTPRRHTHEPITTFSMETINRLSRPRVRKQFSDAQASSKHAQRRPKSDHLKPSQNTLSSSIISCSTETLSSTKQTKPTVPKSSSKKCKTDRKQPTMTTPDHSKGTPMSNHSRSTIVFAPPPTICLTFPMQPELRSSRIVVASKPPIAPRTVKILTKKDPLVLSKRFINLMLS